eukprot:7993153-Pyramimonas_sp.AAC.1
MHVRMCLYDHSLGDQRVRGGASVSLNGSCCRSHHRSHHRFAIDPTADLSIDFTNAFTIELTIGLTFDITTTDLNTGHRRDTDGKPTGH